MAGEPLYLKTKDNGLSLSVQHIVAIYIEYESVPAQHIVEHEPYKRCRIRSPSESHGLVSYTFSDFAPQNSIDSK